MNYKKKYKLMLFLLAIITILGVATIVYGFSESRKTVVIDPRSEYGKELTDISEKAITEAEIDSSYISLQSIVQDSPDSIVLTYHSTNSFKNGVIYSNDNLNKGIPISFFAADLDRYDVNTYLTDKGIQDKNAVCLDEIFGYGQNCLYSTNGNSVELIDPETNKTVFTLLDYTMIKDSKETNALADEINSKYDLVKQPLPIDKDKPYIIIDVKGGDVGTESLINVAFYKGQLFSMHIEETTKEDSKTTITHSVKCYNDSR